MRQDISTPPWSKNPGKPGTIERKERLKRKHRVEKFSAQEYISSFDPHFGVFQELMAFKVREILLLSSPYDAYIMEEDGSLAVKIKNE